MSSDDGNFSQIKDEEVNNHRRSCYDRNFSQIKDEEVNKAKEVLSKNGIGEFLRYLNETEDTWKTIPLNIAVIGNSGVGKSSFINAIRRLTADDDGAAAVGETETTINLKSYEHPLNPLLKFWDLPGVGTPKFPKETYLTEIEVERYDFFLLLSATRFTENDAWLGKEVKKLGKRYFYVRTKIASDVFNNRKAHPQTHNAEKVISAIRENCRGMLKDDETSVFLIDSYKIQQHDFIMLEQRLIEDFPKMKRSALVLSLSASSEQIVRLKVAELRARRWRSSLLSAAVAAVPVPGVSLIFDMGIVLAQAEFYKSQLGLDEKSLERFSKMTSINLQELKTVAAHSGIRLTVDGLKLLARSTPAVATTAAVEECSRFIPFLGSLIAAPLSFSGTYYMLNVVLDKMEEAAVKIVRLASESMAQIEEKGDDSADDE